MLIPFSPSAFRDGQHALLEELRHTRRLQERRGRLLRARLRGLARGPAGMLLKRRIALE